MKYRGGQMMPPRGPRSGRTPSVATASASRMAFRVRPSSSTGSVPVSALCLHASRARYARSASSRWSTMASKSLPPPRGPFCSSLPAARFTAESNACQHARSSACERSNWARLRGSLSASRMMAGAPKSVVALPSWRSVKTKADMPAGVRKSIPLPWRTLAYRGP